MRFGTELLQQRTDAFEFLHGLFLCENGRPEKGIKKIRKSIKNHTDEDQRKIAFEIAAHWEDQTKGGNRKATEDLRKAFNIGAFDRRLFMELDSKLRDAHDIEARKKFHGRIPDGIKDRGDIAFRRACFFLDSGATEKALEILLSHKFNQYEGQSAVRRLYVDCLLVSGLKHFNADELNTAMRRFKAVMEYPENIGSASYLGEHSRLARFMLGVIAERRGDGKLAKELWEGVIRQIGNGKVYVVEGVAAHDGHIRPDESAACALAAMKLKRHDIVVGISAELLASARQTTALDEKEAGKCLRLLIKGQQRKAADEIQRSLKVYKCSSLLRITAALLALDLGQSPGKSPSAPRKEKDPYP